ncbi:hypothetical protein C8R47DRAFT_1159161 [Mycena vitilis]|nr:hypothetical protein C8R47DRAFT_1159161 [Mycena vitilis]
MRVSLLFLVAFPVGRTWRVSDSARAKAGARGDARGRFCTSVFLLLPRDDQPQRNARERLGLPHGRMPYKRTRPRAPAGFASRRRPAGVLRICLLCCRAEDGGRAGKPCTAVHFSIPLSSTSSRGCMRERMRESSGKDG